MTQPTLSELRTARAILWQKWHEGKCESPADVSYTHAAIRSLDTQIAELVVKDEPTYGISQDGIGSFIITHKSGFPRYAVCPCCDKPILSLARAEILAKNLTLLDARCDSIDNLPMEGQ